MTTWASTAFSENILEIHPRSKLSENFQKLGFFVKFGPGSHRLIFQWVIVMQKGNLTLFYISWKYLPLLLTDFQNLKTGIKLGASSISRWQQDVSTYALQQRAG